MAFFFLWYLFGAAAPNKYLNSITPAEKSAVQFFGENMPFTGGKSPNPAHLNFKMKLIGSPGRAKKNIGGHFFSAEKMSTNKERRSCLVRLLMKKKALVQFSRKNDPHPAENHILTKDYKIDMMNLLISTKFNKFQQKDNP